MESVYKSNNNSLNSVEVFFFNLSCRLSFNYWTNFLTFGNNKVSHLIVSTMISLCIQREITASLKRHGQK